MVLRQYVNEESAGCKVQRGETVSNVQDPTSNRKKQYKVQSAKGKGQKAEELQIANRKLQTANAVYSQLSIINSQLLFPFIIAL